MRNLSWLVSFGLLVAACGGVTSDPQSSETLAVSGEKCSDMGATAPAMDGCNTCMCTGDGWACTKAACPPADDVCQDGDTKDTGCNTCSCSGGSWVCTDVACPGPEDACTPGATKPADDDCNTCGCVDGQWACTLVDCEAPPACAPAAYWPAGAFCLVEPVYARPADSDACCEYDSGCSVPDGYTSFNTLAECEAGEETCETGEEKPADDGCNTCSCTADGSWACTEKACPTEVGCGGWLGDTCTKDEYCAYEAGAHCGAADASSVCKPRPELCPLNYAPVCGCDAQTYSNACAAASAGTGVNTEGACATD